MHELIITGGTIVDGTGQPAFTGDVAITEGHLGLVLLLIFIHKFVTD